MCDLMPSNVISASPATLPPPSQSQQQQQQQQQANNDYNSAAQTNHGGLLLTTTNAVSGMQSTKPANLNGAHHVGGSGGGLTVATGVNLAFNNPKAAKLLADFKQIILELSMY